LAWVLYELQVDEYMANNQLKKNLFLQTTLGCLFSLLLNWNMAYSQLQFNENSFSPVVDSLLKTQSGFFAPYYNFPNFYRIQIIYTQVDRDKNNAPIFTQHSWRLMPDEYFNPASLVKVPAAIFSMEKINTQLSKYGVDKYSPLLVEQNYDCQEPEVWDATCVCQYPNIAHYIKRALIVSENSPYKRLYEFLGQGYIQQRLDQLGFHGAKIIQRFASECDEEGNRYTNAINFFDVDSNLLYRQPEQYNENYVHTKDSTIMIGNYVMDGRKKIKGGKDFSNANRLPLHHIHQLMMAVFFPKQMPENLRFNLTQDDLNLMRKYLGLNPEESDDPIYDPQVYWPAYNNYFFYGQSKKATLLKDVRIFNKVAMAYGFLSETAYVADFKNKREFFLSATIYVNKDGVMMDNKYDYTDVGMPFLQNLSLLVYKHELKRKLNYAPDFSELEMLFKK
jgi:hypothetical protein